MRLTIEPSCFVAGEACLLGGQGGASVHLEGLGGLLALTALLGTLGPVLLGTRLHGGLGSSLSLGLVLGLALVVLSAALATRLLLAVLGFLLDASSGTSSVLVTVLVAVALLGVGAGDIALLAALVRLTFVIHLELVVVHFCSF